MTSVKKLKGVFGVAGSVAGAVGAVTSLRKARTDRDRLLLANAVASIAVAITGLLLAIRSARQAEEDK